MITKQGIMPIKGGQYKPLSDKQVKDLHNATVEVMDEVGIKDPEVEFNRWLEEREAILRMNKELNARSTRGGARERAIEGDKIE